mmetsp:Transcript_10655/g.22597  ORF Transcript_10655/g.22597 Transcript_10655/m.22597 type:complete len:205 (-) Transcript_10655:333-947(-)
MSLAKLRLLSLHWMPSSSADAPFASAYLLLAWNLMCRTHQLAATTLKPVSWNSDALTVRFSQQKGINRASAQRMLATCTRIPSISRYVRCLHWQFISRAWKGKRDQFCILVVARRSRGSEDSLQEHLMNSTVAELSALKWIVILKHILCAKARLLLFVPAQQPDPRSSAFVFVVLGQLGAFRPGTSVTKPQATSSWDSRRVVCR